MRVADVLRFGGDRDADCRTYGGIVALTARERADRDARIVAAKLRGRTWPSIAAEHDLTARQAQRIFAEWRERQPGLQDGDAIVELEELIAIQTQAIADLAEVAERDVQDSVKVAAISRRVEIAERRFVCQGSFGGLRAEAEARELLDRFLRACTTHRDIVPTALADDFRAILAELDARRLTRTPSQEAA